MRLRILGWVVLLAVCTVPLSCPACEPIIPLARLLSGSTLAGTMYLAQPLIWLGVAVSLKCVAYAFLEKRLPWSKAFLFMLLANVVSTIPGILTGALAGAMTFIALPVIFLLGKLAEWRLAGLASMGLVGRYTGRWLGVGFTAAYIVTLLMFAFAGSALDSDQFAFYWVFKIIFATLAVSIGMGISAILEEWAIGRLAQKNCGPQSYYSSVTRANYITLGIVLLAAAIETLPRRLSSPHFMISWINFL